MLRVVCLDRELGGVLLPLLLHDLPQFRLRYSTQALYFVGINEDAVIITTAGLDLSISN